MTNFKTPISADLLPSIVLPGALPTYAGHSAIPRFFKGKVKRRNHVVGKASLQFDSDDKLQHLSIDDGHHQGKLIAEEHFGKLKNALPEDLILYREKNSYRIRFDFLKKRKEKALV